MAEILGASCTLFRASGLGVSPRLAWSRDRAPAGRRALGENLPLCPSVCSTECMQIYYHLVSSTESALKGLGGIKGGGGLGITAVSVWA